MASKPLDISEVIQREIEKRRIREEILTAEFLRRQELEAEVRRELMIERAMMRSEGISLFDSSMSSLLHSDLRGLPLHYQNGIGIEGRLSMMSCPEVGSFRGLPLQQPGPVIKFLPEVKNSSLPEVAHLAKRINSNVTGIKRKAETLAIAGSNGMPSISTSKKQHKDWRCALCQVSATCERGLNEHLQGKKHKAKEALLRASKTVSSMTSKSYPSPKKSEMSTKQAVPTGSLNPKQGESPKGNQQHLRFWCGMCNFGTNNDSSMEAHQNGKEHMTLLQKNGGAVITISTVPEDVQKVEETIATKGAKEDLMDNAEETDETAAAQEGQDSQDNAEETKETTAAPAPEGEDSHNNAEETMETAAEEGKKDSLGNTDGEADGLEGDEEENADGNELGDTTDTNEVPCSTTEVI